LKKGKHILIRHPPKERDTPTHKWVCRYEYQHKGVYNSFGIGMPWLVSVLRYELQQIKYSTTKEKNKTKMDRQPT
jgi:hypothetical protein